MQYKELLEMLDSSYSRKFLIYTYNILMPDIKYSANINGGSYSVKDFASNSTSLESFEMCTEDSTDRVLNRIMNSRTVDPIAGVLSDIFPEYMAWDNNEKSPDPNKIEASFIAETGSIIIKTPLDSLILKYSLSKLKDYLNYITLVRQVVSYKEMIKFGGELLYELHTKFNGLIYLPNCMGEYCVCNNFPYTDSLSNYEDYIFYKSETPLPLIVTPSSHVGRGIGGDNPVEFTKVYRMIDILNYIDTGFSSSTRSKLLNDETFLIEMAVLQGNPDLIDMQGYFIIQKNGNKADRSNIYFLPDDELISDNLQELKQTDNFKNLRYKYPGASVSIIQCNYLTYLCKVKFISLGIKDSIDVNELANRLKRWSKNDK